MNEHGVIPDVIDKMPESTLEVIYNSNDRVQEGNELSPTVVRNKPELKWEYEENCYYTLLMVDPDAPSKIHPKFREWHHWLVGNIPQNNVSKGETITHYIGAGPPKGSGLHRYIFLLFKQPGKVDYSTQRRFGKHSGRGRGKFSARKFAKRYGLGEPIAANFFRAKWDSYVTTLYRQLAGK